MSETESDNSNNLNQDDQHTPKKSIKVLINDLSNNEASYKADLNNIYLNINKNNTNENIDKTTQHLELKLDKQLIITENVQ